MRRFLLLFIQTNVHIAVAAVAFLLANAILLDIPFRGLEVLCAQVFFSTWFIYQLSRWLYHKQDLYEDIDDYVFTWFRQHPQLSKVMIATSAICAVGLVLFLKPMSILLLGGLGGISVLYALPVLRPFGSERRLRDVPFIKIFLIALVWSGTSVLLPMTEAGWSLTQHREGFILFVTQFVFILFITLPFDINDYPNDQRTGVKTIPTVLGKKVAYGLMVLLLLLHAGSLLFFYMIQNWNHMPNYFLREGFYIGVMAMCAGMLMHCLFYADKVHKWIIKLVYDSSMIVYLFIVLLTINTPG